MSDHLKRLNSPSGWRIARKTKKFVVKTSPGPHNGNAMPLGVWLRDHMGLALNSKEVKKILTDRSVIVNGKVCTNMKLGIGIFDIVSIPKTDKHYRILRNKKGDYVSVPISAEDAQTQLCKISNKTIVKDGKVQLNLRHGANIVVDSQEYKPKDSIVVKLTGDERFKIIDHFAFAEGNCAMVTGGKHSGKVGQITKIEVIPACIENRVFLKDIKSGEEFDTVENYIFMVGRSTPAVSEWGIEA
ncbi:30S ribosomal protein S4e [Methanomicrobium mobile]|jgi:small subunit ribosomal protein S4e|uniref:30S ribosomal protein S4e n=1 Tax=Methanomicrobium mobile TaxID=2205 RepID=UPI0005B2A41B|nr:30S ribosomal protein S4e [Methanomicrobium mobile]